MVSWGETVSSLKKFLSLLFVISLAVVFQNCVPAFRAMDSSSVVFSSNGTVLYENNCMSCHSDLANSTKINRTPAQISSALTTVPQMSFLQGLLSPENLRAISAVLERQSDENPFVCSNDKTPSVDTLRRLSRDEYINTLVDLFAGSISMGEIQNQINQFPAEVGDNGNPFDRGVTTVTSGIFSAHVATANRIGDLIQGDQSKRSQIFSESCFSQSPVNDACINSFVQRFAKRALRRPVESSEQTIFRAAYRIGENSAESAKFLTRAILLHPSFLYHTEFKGNPVAGAQNLYDISPYELAARLSYLVIGSLPDSNLMAAADNQSILDPAVLDQQAQRLLASERAKISFRRFYKKYLGMDSIPAAAYSSAFLGSVSANGLNEEAAEELLSFTDYITLSNRPLSELLTSRVAFVRSSNLASLYGVTANPSGNGQVTLPANRSGILSRAGFLLSGNNATNPIHRGYVVRTSLLCDKIGSPDPNLLPAGSLEHPPLDPNMTTRERWTQKTSAPICMSCHSQINPIGFALESFDSIGRVRTHESIFDSQGNITRSLAVDARVEPQIESTRESSVDGGNQLAAAMANTQKFNACYVRKWHEFAMRKTIGPNDGCIAAHAYEVLKQPNGTPLEMIKAFIGHKNFSQRKQ